MSESESDPELESEQSEQSEQLDDSEDEKEPEPWEELEAYLGEPPPDELRALWKAQLSGDPFFTRSTFGEVRFVTKMPRGAKHYLLSTDGDAWEQMFADIVWIAQEADGALIGYYRPGASSLATAPIVYLDNEGQLEISARSLLDHFAARDPFLAFVRAAGLPMTLGARELGDQPSLAERLNELVHAGQAERTGAVRPLDPAPRFVSLRDGRVVLVCVNDAAISAGWSNSVAFLFDPETTTFERLPDTPIRVGLTDAGAGQLPDGRAVFVVGRELRCLSLDLDTRTWTVSAEEPCDADLWGAVIVEGSVLVRTDSNSYLYDPVGDTWTTTSIEGDVRTEQVRMVSLPDGALAIGGIDNDYTAQATCTRFHASTKTWAPACDLPLADRNSHAVTLPNGRVLVAFYEAGEPGWTIYDPTRDTWSEVVIDELAVGPMTRLPDGRIAFFGRGPAVWDQGTITQVGDVARRSDGHAFALPDGRVLLVGDTLTANIVREPELWDSRTGEGSAIPGFEKQRAKQLAFRDDDDD